MHASYLQKHLFFADLCLAPLRHDQAALFEVKRLTMLSPVSADIA